MTNLEFVNMPAHILSLDLHINHKFILSLANSFERGCFLTNAKIGKLLGISANRVSHIIGDLVELGYLTRKITYKEDSKEIDKRTIFFNAAIKKAHEVVKKAVSKAKEMKAGYVAVETEKVEQVTFGKTQYKKPTTAQNTTTRRKGNIHAPMCSHNIDWNALGELEQQMNFIIK